MNQKRRSWGRKFSAAVRVSPLYGGALGHARKCHFIPKEKKKRRRRNKPFSTDIYMYDTVARI